MEKKVGKYNTQLVKDFLKEKHLSKASFSRQIGVCLETINSFLRGSDKVGIIPIVKISKFTNIPLCKLVNKQEHAESTPEQNDKETSEEK